MIIITNRNYQPKKSPEEIFGKRFNAKGPDELRLLTAKKINKRWKIDIHEDKEKLKDGSVVDASEHAFLQLQKRMLQKKRDALFYVHGFNNDFHTVLETCHQLEKNYPVEIIAFTWPANGREGGGLFKGAGGVASYKSDKRDAIRSVAALDRVLERLNDYFLKYQNESQRCGQRISLLMHSMGNYLFKHLLKSSIYHGETALFDNVILASADVNNYAHAEWVDKIAYRRRLYITINENDYALQASRMKFGQKQMARLGHFTQNLYSKNAIYLDFTEAARIGKSHAYFVDKTIQYNKRVHKLFHKMFLGEKIESQLPYNPHARTYMVK